jgi:hypothetical protein
MLLLSMSLSACYQFMAVDDGVTPDPGRTIRAHLSPLQSFDLGRITINEIAQVEGEVYRDEGESLGLWAQWLRSRYGTRHEATGSVFYIPHEQIERLDERQLMPGKTVLAVIGVTAAMITTFELVRRAATGGLSGSGQEPTQRSITAPISFPW